MTQLPWENDTILHWRSVAEVAVKWRRTPRCIRKWCEDGTLIRFGCRVYRDAKGKWWIGERLSSHLNTGNSGTPVHTI
jgi:hypothetical protein